MKVRPITELGQNTTSFRLFRLSKSSFVRHLLAAGSLGLDWWHAVLVPSIPHGRGRSTLRIMACPFAVNPDNQPQGKCPPVVPRNNRPQGKRRPRRLQQTVTPAMTPPCTFRKKPTSRDEKYCSTGRRIISTRRYEQSRFRTSREGTAGAGGRAVTGAVWHKEGRGGTGTGTVFLGL